MFGLDTCVLVSICVNLPVLFDCHYSVGSAVYYILYILRPKRFCGQTAVRSTGRWRHDV